MLKEIHRSFPQNIKDEDKGLFNKAMIHSYREVAFEIKKNWFWDNLMQMPILKFTTLFRGFFSILLGRKRLVILRSGIIVTNSYSPNYFHLLNDVCTKIISLEKLGVDSKIVLPNSLFRNKYAEYFIKRLGHPYLLTPVDSIILFRKAYFITSTAGEGNQDPEIFSLLKTRLNGITGSSTSARRIFISRPENAYRSIFPKDEFEGLLKAHNFEIVDTSIVAPEEQIKMFRGCSHLIAAHGAGLTNMLFMPAGSKVLEIRMKDDDHNNCYFAMANTLKLKYYYFLAKSRDKSSCVQADNFEVSVSNFKSELLSFLEL